MGLLTMFPLPAGTRVSFVSRGHWRHSAGGKGGLPARLQESTSYSHNLVHKVLSSAKCLQGAAFSSIWLPCFPQLLIQATAAQLTAPERTGPGPAQVTDPHTFSSAPQQSILWGWLSREPKAQSSSCKQRFNSHGFLASVCPPISLRPPGLFLLSQ